MMPELLKPDRFDWVVETITSEPSCIQKSMFGCLAYYVFGKLVLVTTSKKEPWNGLLVPTEKEFHESLRKEIASLKKHSVLGKWLYLSETSDDFEEAAGKIVLLIKGRDKRIGVETFSKMNVRRKAVLKVPGKSNVKRGV